MPLIWMRSTESSSASHHLKWGEGSENFADHRVAHGSKAMTRYGVGVGLLLPVLMLGCARDIELSAVQADMVAVEWQSRTRSQTVEARMQELSDHLSPRSSTPRSRSAVPRPRRWPHSRHCGSNCTTSRARCRRSSAGHSVARQPGRGAPRPGSPIGRGACGRWPHNYACPVRPTMRRSMYHHELVARFW